MLSIEPRTKLNASKAIAKPKKEQEKNKSTVTVALATSMKRKIQDLRGILEFT